MSRIIWKINLEYVKEAGRRVFSKRYLRNVIEGKPGNTSNRIAFCRTKDRVQKVRSMRQGCQVFSHEFCCEENKMITSVWVRPDDVQFHLISSWYEVDKLNLRSHFSYCTFYLQNSSQSSDKKCQLIYNQNCERKCIFAHVSFRFISSILVYHIKQNTSCSKQQVPSQYNHSLTA